MLGIICGGGSYPKLIAQACVKKQSPFCLLFIKGFAEPSDFSEFCVPALSVNFGGVQKMLDFFRENNVDIITLAGKVKRPNFNELSLDKKGRSWLVKLGKSLIKGDDCLLKSVADLLEQEGFRVIAGTDFLADIFLPEGVYSKISPTQSDFDDIYFGFEQAKIFGKEDIGQSIVVANGEVIRKEDSMGTDNLIIEAGKDSANPGILVKVLKPQQDLRIDLPTVGPDTIEILHQCGFKGLAIEAEKCIIIDKDQMVKLADQYGLFFVSYRAKEGRKKTKIFISAGEASGDYLGGLLMRNIQTVMLDKNVEFFGIGGTNMCAAGLKLLFPISELSIIGILEVINKIFHVKRLIKEAVQAILDYNPDIVITIDSSGFHHRVDKLLKKHKFANPIVHYVAPPVWAWRKWRVKSLHKFIDKLMVLLPFEKNIFEKYRVNTAFVGHPIATDSDFNEPDSSFLQNFKKAHKLDDNDLVITLLPGSRRSELSRHLPILQDFVRLMHSKYNNLKIIIPTLPDFLEFLQKSTANWDIRPIIVTTKSEKILGYYSSKIAVVASGTATLELARVGLPAVVIYRTSYVTYRVVKFLIRVPYVCLLNIIEGKEVVPELLQNACTPENILHHAELLLVNPSAISAQKQCCLDVMKKLTVDKFASANEVVGML